MPSNPNVPLWPSNSLFFSWSLLHTLWFPLSLSLPLSVSAKPCTQIRSLRRSPLGKGYVWQEESLARKKSVERASRREEAQNWDARMVQYQPDRRGKTNTKIVSSSTRAPFPPPKAPVHTHKPIWCHRSRGNTAELC